MDKRLLELWDERLPRMNEAICNNMVETELAGAINYINNIFRCTVNSYTKGMEFNGIELCSPEETYTQIVSKQRPVKAYDVCRNDMYMVKAKFTLNGKPLKDQYTMLPFARDGNLIYKGDTLYKITPVIGAQAFNIENGNVYLYPPRTRLAFTRMQIVLLQNNQPLVTEVVRSQMYQGKSNERWGEDIISLWQRQFTKYGPTLAIKKFLGVDIAVGGPELDSFVDGGEYFVYRSMQRRPNVTKSVYGKDYVPTELRVMVEAKDHSKDLDGAIAALINCADHFPTLVTPDEIDNLDMWVRLLGRMTFRKVEKEALRFSEMTAHVQIVEDYLDLVTKQMLCDTGVYVDDIYELFDYLNKNFFDMIIRYDAGTMYDKEIAVTKHLLFPIVSNIFNFMFAINRFRGQEKTDKDLNKILGSNLRRDSIMGLSKNGEVNIASIATQCKVFSATCELMSQSRANTSGGRGKKGKKRSAASHGPEAFLHASQVEVASYLMMSKSDPTGRSKANPFLYFQDPYKYITGRRPKLEKTIEKLDKYLQR